MRSFPVLLLLAAALLAGCRSHTEQLLLCGLGEVSLVRKSDIVRGTPEKLWSWKAKDRAELSEPMRKAFGTTDECKPVRDGAAILISASSGGCALVEWPSGNVLWHARVTNAHSLELMPGNRVVVASSTGTTGNKLILFDLSANNTPLWEDKLHSAHGVVWDAKRNQLWAMGMDELRSYRLVNWDTDKPSFELVSSHKLPDPDGHDLQAVPGSPDLILSTNARVFLFDRDRGTFRPHPTLGDQAKVKALSPHPTNGDLAWIAGEKGNWWSGTLRFLKPPSQHAVPGEKLYKARWFTNP